MDFLTSDFNDADAYFEGAGSREWADIEVILQALPLFVQGSDQAGRKGSLIFDPKATNAFLASHSKARGWRSIQVPEELREFGVGWDGGKASTLAEWQFSNYPFLWNNIIRSEAVYSGRVSLPGLSQVRALIIVTKSGVFPASNSTLYYEQGRAQIRCATELEVFSVPIRLVGLTLPLRVSSVPVTWSEYEKSRHDRTPKRQLRREARVQWKTTRRKYGMPAVRLEAGTSTTTC